MSKQANPQNLISFVLYCLLYCLFIPLGITRAYSFRLESLGPIVLAIVLGDEERARQHYEEVQRLSRLQSADAVERAVAQSEAQLPKDNTNLQLNLVQSAIGIRSLLHI